MPELDDVRIGETIAVEWGNAIRDRTIQRYADAAERDELHPNPTEGDLSYLEDTNSIEVYNGFAWVSGIGPGAVTVTRIADGAVTTDKIATQAVTTAKIANNAVTAVKLAAELPRGVLGYALRTSNITGLTDGPVDLPDLIVPVSVPAGRLIRVVGYVRAWTAPAQGNEANLLIREGNNTLGLKRVIAVTANRAEGGVVEALIRPSAGPHTYKLSFEQVTGTGSWAVQASSTLPAHILVEDIGAA